MRKTGAEIIVRLLQQQGIHMLTGIPGGANLPLYDALRHSPIRHILARHEQGAGFIAQGMARATGNAAVCLSTSGPGATNLLTAIADAKLDSVPIIAITGQVPKSLIGTDAFQEVNTLGLTFPITKKSYLVQNAEELIEVIPKAFETAESGRPGPVVVDVPKDIQTEIVQLDAWPAPWVRNAPPDCDPERIRRLSEMIHTASRPVLYIGGGIISSGAQDALQALARKNTIPVASTLSGLGAFPADDPLFLGMLGMHGARHTNLVLDQADLLLALGVRFDDRATGRAEAFCPGAAIAHIDIDQHEINKIKPAKLSIIGDVGQALQQLIPLTRPDKRSEWMDRVKRIRDQYPLSIPPATVPLRPTCFIRQLSHIIDGNAIITTDVGQHQMWVAQAYPFMKPRTLLSSGGLGTMGFGLPAAIGAALARPGTKVVCISGDGSFLMNIQELSTLAELELDVSIIILNNRHLGLVRQQQELFYDGRLFATEFVTPPDYAAIARGFGIQAHDLSTVQDPVAYLESILSGPGPRVINVPIHQQENVYPMVPPGSTNREMIEPKTAQFVQDIPKAG